MTELVRIIYASQPFGYDAATLNGILVQARRRNARNGITGALVCRHDIYLQLLEGPRTQVQATFDRIKDDDRHVDVRQLPSHPATGRLFGDWAMLHDPAHSLIWTIAEVDDGAVDRTSPDALEAMFATLAAHAKADPLTE